MAAGGANNNMLGGPQQQQQQFGDTTFTKVFVGGLAWETQRDTLSSYFEQFGEILEAVVITDKSTGRSKGYGFVTFHEAEAALRACADPYPVIDGRRANCNLAYLGVHKSKPTSPRHGGGGGGKNYTGTKASQTAGLRGGIRMGGFSSTATFPHYAVQQGAPYNAYGYSAYAPEYAYPLSYNGMYGGGGAQYHPMYGGGSGGVVAGHSSSAGFYPFSHFDQGASGATYAHGGTTLAAVQRPHTVPYCGVAGFTPQIYGGLPLSFPTPPATPPSQGMTMALVNPPTQMIGLVPRSYRIIPTPFIPSTAASEKPLA